MASYFYDLFVYVCMYKSSEGRRDAVSPGAGVTGVTASWYRLQGQNPDPLPEHWVIWTTELSPAPGLSYFKCALFPHLSVRKHPRTKEIQITSSVFKVKAYVSIELVNCSLQIQLLSLRLMLSTVVCVFVRMVLSTYENQMWQLHGEPWQQPALRKREAETLKGCYLVLHSQFCLQDLGEYPALPQFQPLSPILPKTTCSALAQQYPLLWHHLLYSFACRCCDGARTWAISGEEKVLCLTVPVHYWGKPRQELKRIPWESVTYYFASCLVQPALSYDTDHLSSVGTTHGGLGSSVIHY